MVLIKVAQDPALVEAIDKIVGKAKEKVADGKLTLRDVVELIFESSTEFLILALSVPSLSKEEKIEYSVYLASKIYDDIIRPIDLPFIPNIVEGIFDSVVGRILPHVVSGVMEGIFTALENKSETVRTYFIDGKKE